MNATVPVKNPSVMSVPPMISVIPATPNNEESGTEVPPKRPKTFCNPWQRNNKPTTMRRRA
jgi:hypothetical protein